MNTTTSVVTANVQPEVLQKVMNRAKYSTATEIYTQEDLTASAWKMLKISSKHYNSVTKAKVCGVKKKP